MKHYHVLIIAGRQVDLNSQFFRLAIGSSMQGNRDYLFLQSLAVSHGYFFHLYDNYCVDFLFKIAESLGLDRVSLIDCDVREWVRNFKAGTSLPLSQQSLSNQHHTRYFLDLNYRVACNLAKRHTSINLSK